MIYMQFQIIMVILALVIIQHIVRTRLTKSGMNLMTELSLK